MRPNDECVEVLASRRHLTSLGLLTSAVDPEAASFSSNGRRAAIGCGPGCGLSRKNCNVECMNPSHNRVSGYDKSYFAYHAVPTNGKSMSTFRHYVMDLWRRALQRRSQRDRSTWARIAQLAAEFLPPVRILHPWPSERFAVKYPRWEPGA